MSSLPIPDLDSVDLGRRLQGLRKLRGKTQMDVAEALGVSRPTVAAIEAGQRRLDARLLLDLARAYGAALSDLVRESPPEVALRAQFRIPADARDAETDALERAVVALETHVTRYLQLEKLLESPLRPAAVPVYRYDARRLDRDAEAIADAERRRMGMGDGAILRLRDTLEREAGIRVFSIPLPSDVAGLYALSSEAGPCVAINAKHPSVRQRWSLAHEFGHFLTRLERPEITQMAGYQRVPEQERFAERFAGAFLMPASGLERRIHELESTDRQITVAELLLIADEYEVSLQALVLRLEAVRVVPPTTWDRLIHSGGNIQAAGRMLGVQQPPPDTRCFPKRFVLMALEAYDRELLTEREVADLLNEDRLTVRAILERMSDAGQDVPSRPMPALHLSESLHVGPGH